MKKVLFISSLALLTLAVAFAPPQSYGDYTGAITPYNSPLDTLTDAANDTVKATVTGVKQSVAFTLVSKKITGDPSGVTFKLYVHAGTTMSYKSAPIVSITSPDGDTTINYAFTGNPYTTYYWVIDGAGTQTSSHQVFMNIR